MHPFRVFLSYSHEDARLVARVAALLEEKGLKPIWDRNIRAGSAFTEAIKGLIVHAHVFMPIVTDNSRARPWVHQETGYAMALNIPILPLAIGNLPGEMIAQLQALRVSEDLSDLPTQLDSTDLERMVMAASPTTVPIVVEVADDTEERFRLTIQYAKRVANELGERGRVRQRAPMSLFNAPDRPEHDPIWKVNDGTIPRSAYLHKLAREQRRIMERLARDAGCSLIIDPTATLPELDAAATRVRLAVLLEFLESMPDELVQVACSPTAGHAVTTMVGDWFLSEAHTRAAGQGWRYSLFTWHAPTVLARVREFDNDLEALLRESQITPAQSRIAAIAEIRKRLTQL